MISAGQRSYELKIFQGVGMKSVLLLVMISALLVACETKKAENDKDVFSPADMDDTGDDAMENDDENSSDADADVNDDVIIDEESSDEAASGPDLDLPEGPTNFTASTGTYHNRIKLNWDSLEEGKRVYILRSESVDGIYEDNNIWTESDSYIDEEIVAEKRYYYKVYWQNKTLVQDRSALTAAEEGYSKLDKRSYASKAVWETANSSVPFSNEITDIAFSMGQMLYVADTGQNLISVFSPEGEFVEDLTVTRPRYLNYVKGHTMFSTGDEVRPLAYFPDYSGFWLKMGENPPLSPQGLASPPSIISGPLNDRVVAISDEDCSCIKEYYIRIDEQMYENDILVYARKYGSQGSGETQLSGPKGLTLLTYTVDWNFALFNLYVADSDNNRIQVFIVSLGQHLFSFGSFGSAEGQFNRPLDVEIDRDGYVFVADSGNNRIQKFTTTGDFVMSFGEEGSGAGQLKNPTGIAVDDVGNVYVADSGNARIQVFAPVE
jgi:DNA-binding beta-propeller fold protein YncE